MVTDMNGVKIKVGAMVKKHSCLNKVDPVAKVRTVDAIAPMYNDGELMVWFKEGGGAHHPKAVEVVDERSTTGA